MSCCGEFLCSYSISTPNCTAHRWHFPFILPIFKHIMYPTHLPWDLRTQTSGHLTLPMLLKDVVGLSGATVVCNTQSCHEVTEGDNCRSTRNNKSSWRVQLTKPKTDIKLGKLKWIGGLLFLHLTQYYLHYLVPSPNISHLPTVWLDFSQLLILFNLELLTMSHVHLCRHELYPLAVRYCTLSC